MKRRATAIALFVLLLLCAAFCTAPAAAAQSAEQYLQEGGDVVTAFAQDPVAYLWQQFGDLVQQTILDAPITLLRYGKVLLFLWLAMQLLPAKANTGLVQKLCLITVFLTGGQDLLLLAEDIQKAVVSWRDYLAAFIPAFSGLVAATGNMTGAAMLNGLYISIISLVGMAVNAFFLPLLNIYIALTGSFYIGGFQSFLSLMQSLMRLVKKLLYWAATAFCIVFGLLQSATAGTQAAGGAMAQAAVNSIPIVGSAISSAAGAIWSSLFAMRSVLGILATLTCLASFAPYLWRTLVYSAGYYLLSMLAGALGMENTRQVCGTFFEMCQFMLALVSFYLIMEVGTTCIMVLLGGQRL